MTTTLRTTRSRNQPGASSTAAAAAVANSGLALVTNGLTGRAAGGGAAEKDGEKEGAAAGRDKSQQQGRRVIRLRTRGGAGGGPQREPPAALLLENGGDNSPILDKKEGQEKQEEREEEEMKLYERWAEEYYEIVEQLPLELHRTFALMRELENKMQSKIQFMASHTIAYRDARLTHKSRQGGEESMAAQSGSDGRRAVAAEEEEDMVMPNYGTSSDADAEGEEYDEEVYHEAPAVIHHPSSGSDPQSKGGKSPTRTSQATINQQATFTTSPTPKAARQSLLSGIARASNEAIRAAEEKVGLAVTAYDWVDRHIRRLDADLQRSESSLLLGLRAGTEASRGVRDALGMRENQGGEGAGSTSYNRSNGTTSGGGAAGWEDESMMSGQSTPMVSGLVGGGSATAGKRDKNAKNRSNNAACSDGSDANASTTLLADMAIDPNEPKYCYCDQVSSGDMVACDNEDCPREWFHYHCVGLASPPKGRWYCLFCAPPGFKGSGSFPDDAPCLPPGYGPNKRSHLGSSHPHNGGGQNKKKKRKK